MQLTRPRFWALGLLITLYLVGVLLLSAVTLHEPKTNGFASRSNEQSQSLLSSKSKPYRRSRIQWCSDLSYRKVPKESVALASFPGSGNTWLRYLLQQATGTLTGSVYKDYGLLKNGFPAESTTNGSVLVVKTHEWGPLARKQFQRAVLLVRAPGPAIQAEFNRQSGGHVGFASPDRYRRMKGKYWRQFVYDKLGAWKKSNLDWLKNFSGPTHVIFYEQLVENVENTLRSVLEFLQFPVNPGQLKCAVDRQEGIYRRKKRVLNFDPFSPEMKARMKKEQEEVYEAIYKIAAPSDNNNNSKK